MFKTVLFKLGPAIAISVICCCLIFIMCFVYNEDSVQSITGSFVKYELKDKEASMVVEYKGKFYTTQNHKIIISHVLHPEDPIKLSLKRSGRIVVGE